MLAYHCSCVAFNVTYNRNKCRADAKTLIVRACARAVTSYPNSSSDLAVLYRVPKMSAISLVAWSLSRFNVSCAVAPVFLSSAGNVTGGGSRNVTPAPSALGSGFVLKIGNVLKTGKNTEDSPS